MLDQVIVRTVTFKMLHTFLLKKQSNRYTKIKFCHSSNSKGKDLNVLFKMGLSQAINKFSLINKLISLEPLEKNGEIIKVYASVTSQHVI